MRGSRRAALLAIAAIVATVAAAACSHGTHDGGAVGEAALPALTLTDDTSGLMLTWIDDKGDTHVVLRPADVPAAGRALVRVVVEGREDGTHDRFYVADLTKPGEGGAYPTRTMPRHDWEAEIERRREAFLGGKPQGAPPPGGAARGGQPPPPAAANSAAKVIIYGASWCGACHQAADYLRSKGIAYVLKDVEQTPGAAAEMQEKLARAGRRGNSIPVIDVAGQILVGFSGAALYYALAQAGVAR